MAAYAVFVALQVLVGGRTTTRWRGCAWDHRRVHQLDILVMYEILFRATVDPKGRDDFIKAFRENIATSEMC